MLSVGPDVNNITEGVAEYVFLWPSFEELSYVSYFDTFNFLYIV